MRALIVAFQDVFNASRLVQRLLIEDDAHLWAWLPGDVSAERDLSPSQARALTAQHCGALWHRDTVSSWQPGLVECSPATLRAIDTLNKAKWRFKQSVLSLRQEGSGQRLETLLRSVTTNRRRDENVRQALEESGMIGLDLRLCYRNFQCLDADVRAVSWTWIRSTSSIRRTSHAEAVALAEKGLDGHAREMVLELLASVSSTEMFAVRRPVAKHLRANVWVGTNKPAGLVAHSPLFYPAGSARPEKVWDYAPTERPRLRRSDRRIEDDAFIHALNLYRYRNETRRAD